MLWTFKIYGQIKVTWTLRIKQVNIAVVKENHWIFQNLDILVRIKDNISEEDYKYLCN